MNEDIYTRSYLAADRGERQGEGHQDHCLQSREHVIAGIGMNGA
jgi:hypothetical protein